MRRISPLCVVFVVGLSLAFAPASATTYLVKPDGTGDFPTIHDAVSASTDGDVIELADGTFTGDGNRDVSYSGKVITIRSQSGNPETCTIDPEGVHPDARHRAFQFLSGETPQARLEGVKITNGYVGGGQSGGAILCDHASSPTIENCVFEQNRGFSSGGAVACADGSAPIISDCMFIENTVDENWGGGLICNGSSPSLIRCEFIGNQSPSGAGMAAIHGAAPKLTDCRFSGNTGTGRGGAINVYDASMHAAGCTFMANQAPEGGAIFFFTSTGFVAECFFSGNSGTIGGAVQCDLDSSPEFEGCTFVENSGGLGGGMASYYSSPVARQCTFVSNAASTQGGGLYLWDSGFVVENCIIAFSGQGEAVTCGGDSEATLSCCDLFGNAGGDWVGCVEDQLGITGNISADPLFCGPQNPEEPYTLHEDSPCAPEVYPFCGLIGAWPVGCGSTSGIPDDGPVLKPTTWGQIKAGAGN